MYACFSVFILSYYDVLTPMSTQCTVASSTKENVWHSNSQTSSFQKYCAVSLLWWDSNFDVEAAEALFRNKKELCGAVRLFANHVMVK